MSNAGELLFKRVCKLLVSNQAGQALDLSALHIKFAVKRSDTQTPNMADIRVYNLDFATADLIKKEFTTVVLQAGYEGSYGVIFKGNIKQVLSGRESATDTFVDIVSGDGDIAYNFAIVNQSLAAGSTPQDHLDAAMKPMADKGVTSGYQSQLQGAALPRGKVMYGTARDIVRSLADSNGCGWSIQDEKLNFVKQSAYVPGEAVVLTSKTGMIGTPTQTNEGVDIKCLLNPFIKVGGRVKVDNASIAQLKVNFQVPGSPANTPPPLNADGVYYVLVIEHQGDNRGVEWYTSLRTVIVDITTNPLNSVLVGNGS